MLDQRKILWRFCGVQWHFVIKTWPNNFFMLFVLKGNYKIYFSPSLKKYDFLYRTAESQLKYEMDGSTQSRIFWKEAESQSWSS